MSVGTRSITRRFYKRFFISFTIERDEEARGAGQGGGCSRCLLYLFYNRITRRFYTKSKEVLRYDFTVRLGGVQAVVAARTRAREPEVICYNFLIEVIRYGQ